MKLVTVRFHEVKSRNLNRNYYAIRIVEAKMFR